MNTICELRPPQNKCFLPTKETPLHVQENPKLNQKEAFKTWEKGFVLYALYKFMLEATSEHASNHSFTTVKHVVRN